ncbi:MAG: ferredoxin [Romboutsia sp.]|nr:ferredoxin [Romboutsia sp.]
MEPNKLDKDVEVLVGKYKLKVVRDLCIGAASCLAIAPETYILDDENKAVVQTPTSDDPDTILLSAQSCPTNAIIVTDAETGEQVWPA